MNDDVVRDRLRRFGLSEKQASTYLTLLELGEATAGELVEATGTSKGYVYEVMRELADLGVATLHDQSTPTVIRPIPPNETVEDLVDEITSIQDELQRRYTTTTREAPEVDIVKSRQTSFKRLRGLISQASEEVFLAVPGPAIPELAESLDTAIDRGAFVFLLLGDTTQDDEAILDQASECAHVVRRWSAHGNPFAASIDDQSSFIGDSNLLHGEHRSDDNCIFVRNSPKTTGAIISTMTNFWAEGTETFAADPPELPASMDSFRECVVVATLHRRAGREVDVEIPVGEADRDRLRGRIVGIKQSLLEPTSSDFPLENSLEVAVDDGPTVTIGGERAFVEDYSTSDLELFPVERS